MGMLDWFLRKNSERRELYLTFILDIDKWIHTFELLLRQPEVLNEHEYENLEKKGKELYARGDKLFAHVTLFDDSSRKKAESKYKTFLEIKNSFRIKIQHHNDTINTNRITAARKLIGKVDGYTLDDQQMLCVVSMSESQNVIAGAGTGKTTTILGKVIYLLKTQQYSPKDILILSYTKAAAKEMKERIQSNVHEDIEVSTFHRFGYSILAKVEGKKPDVYLNLNGYIKNKIEELCKENQFANALFSYLGNSDGTDKSDLDSAFNSKEAYFTYVKEHAPVTLHYERVKSYGEMRIANFLFINGIHYKYECSYEYDTADEEHRQYHPDFFLPDYKIYIEFYGINRKGEVPEWFEGDDATQTYLKSKQWKEEIHNKYNTILIECYAYEDSEGILEDCLRERLTRYGVIFNPVSYEELLGSVKDISKYMSLFFSTMQEVICLSRNNRIHGKELLEYAENDPYSLMLARLVIPVLDSYEEYLKTNHLVDFTDMLNLSADYIEQDKFVHPYKYIIVDEYQDITASQYRFLSVLRKSKDYKLFCVGDDWQSIYRFNGSDVSYITHFYEYWKDASVNCIETTYRFAPDIVKVSSQFIQKNPYQIKKNIHSEKMESTQSISKIETKDMRFNVEILVDRLRFLPINSTVYLLGRYSFDIDFLKTDSRLKIKYNTATQTKQVYFGERLDLKITFYTVHSSKGLQADYVFLLNTMNGKLGFPSRVIDVKLKDNLLASNDDFDYAEERRLFYVALTRAKSHIYLLCVKGHVSDFIYELDREFILKNDAYTCPLCGAKLRLIHGSRGKFFGCSNYSTLHCTYTRSAEVKYQQQSSYIKLKLF